MRLRLHRKQVHVYPIADHVARQDSGDEDGHEDHVGLRGLRTKPVIQERHPCSSITILNYASDVAIRDACWLNLQG